MQPPGVDRPEAALKLKFLSHGTLESADLDRSRQFYEEFLPTRADAILAKLGLKAQ